MRIEESFRVDIETPNCYFDSLVIEIYMMIGPMIAVSKQTNAKLMNRVAISRVTACLT